MSEPRYLEEVELTGARAKLRDATHAAIVFAVAVAAVGYCLPANRAAGNAQFQSHYAVGSVWALIAFALVGIAWWRRRRRPGYGAGIRFGFAAIALSVVGMLPLLGIANRKLEHAYGYQVFWIGVGATIGLGALAMVCEPLFYIHERRHLERDVDPQFPSARVVAGRRASQSQTAP